MNKNKKILKFEIFSIIFILLIGTLLHFTFKWSNNNLFVGAFSAINESVWEHLKILFFPMLITIISGQICFKKDISNYLCIKTKGLLVALTFIVVFFYTYSGILGTHYPLIDIISFVIAIIIGEIYTLKKIKANNECNNKLALITLIALATMFIFFTYYPSQLGIFKDPKTHTYGISQ